MLAEGHDDERRQQWPKRRAEVAADLEKALRKAVPPARGRAGDPGRFGVEHGAADADQRDRHEGQPVGAGEGQEHQADQGEAHADRQDEV